VTFQYLRLFLLLLFLFPGLFLGFPLQSSAERLATDELSVSHNYAYRALTRQLASAPAHRFSDNVKPISFREIASLQPSETFFQKKHSVFMNTINSVNEVKRNRQSFQPAREFHTHSIYTSKENAKVTSNFGEKYDGYRLGAFSIAGNFYLNRHFVISHESRIDIDETSTEFGLYRFRLKTGFDRYSLSLARESLVLGPGYFGNLLLSNNVEPENTTMFKIEDPYKFPYIGYLRLYLWHIAYDDNNRVNKDPNLLGSRLTIKPNKYFEASVTRMAYFGGRDNDRVDSLKDIVKLVTAEDENASTSINTDQLAAMDISLYLPGVKKNTPFSGAKLYSERVWNDVKAIWQEEDKNDGVFFKLLGTSFLHGLYLTTGKLDFHLEYVKTTTAIYAHGEFGRDGLTDSGYIIGHFIGRDAQAYLSELYYEFTPKVHGFVQLGRIKRGLHLSDQQITNQYGLGANYFHSRRWQFEFKLRYLASDLTDIDDSPVVYKFVDEKDEEIQSILKATYYFKNQ